MKIGCIGRTRPAIFDRALVAIELVLALTSFTLVTHFIFRGDVHMTSAKLIDFWIPLPLVTVRQPISTWACFWGAFHLPPRIRSRDHTQRTSTPRGGRG